MAHSSKPRENTRDAYGVSYLQAFGFCAEYHVCSGTYGVSNLRAFSFDAEYHVCVVVLYLQPMYVGVIFDQRRWRSKNTATRYQGVRMAHS